LAIPFAAVVLDAAVAAWSFHRHGLVALFRCVAVLVLTTQQHHRARNESAKRSAPGQPCSHTLREAIKLLSVHLHRSSSRQTHGSAAHG
jgi:hypothetical protein